MITTYEHFDNLTSVEKNNANSARTKLKNMIRLLRYKNAVCLVNDFIEENRAYAYFEADKLSEFR